jgi:dihydrofolate reductase
MRVSAVVAMAQNRVIGVNGQLPWKLPEDLKRFKSLTWGHPIIMGRKTYESIGRLLPGRQNILITRRKGYGVAGAQVAHSLEAALALCPQGTEEAFIIGGAEIYEMALPKIQRIYLTWIRKDIAGDTYFPEFNMKDYREVESADFSAEAEGGVSYSFKTLDRLEK